MRTARRILTSLLVASLALTLALALSIPVDGLLNRGRVAALTNTAIPGPEGEVLAFVARPSAAGDGEALPAVIMIHEFWGLKPSIVGKAEALAEEGYLVVAPDTLRGRTTSWLPKAIWQALTTPEEAIDADLAAVFDWLAARPEVDATRVAVMGFCFGGTASLRYSLQNPALAATVVFYGQPITDPVRLQALPGPLLGIFGEEDPSIPVAEVQAFEVALEAAGVAHQITLYRDKGHAFVESIEDIRRDGAQEAAWNELLEFLDLTVKNPPETAFAGGAPEAPAPHRSALAGLR